MRSHKTTHRPASPGAGGAGARSPTRALARVRSGPRRSPLCFITRRFAPRTMLTGIAFVVAPRIRGRRARRIRGRICEHGYLGMGGLGRGGPPLQETEADLLRLLD